MTEPTAQLNIGATFKFTDPPGGKMHGHVDARDPITGKEAWSVKFPEPPLASLLSTAATWCSCPTRAAGCTPTTPRPARSCGSTTTASGHNGGIISYAANGKQYIAVVTGFPSMVSEGYPAMFGPPYKTMEQNTGALIVYTLE